MTGQESPVDGPVKRRSNASLKRPTVPFDRALHIGHNEPDMLPKPNAWEAAVPGVLEHRLAGDAEEACDVVCISESGALEADWRR